MGLEIFRTLLVKRARDIVSKLLNILRPRIDEMDSFLDPIGTAGRLARWVG